MKAKRKVQTYKDFVTYPPNPNKETTKKPGDKGIVNGKVIEYV